MCATIVYFVALSVSVGASVSGRLTYCIWYTIPVLHGFAHFYMTCAILAEFRAQSLFIPSVWYWSTALPIVENRAVSVQIHFRHRYIYSVRVRPFLYRYFCRNRLSFSGLRPRDGRSMFAAHPTPRHDLPRLPRILARFGRSFRMLTRLTIFYNIS